MKRVFRSIICALSIAIPVALYAGESWHMIALLAATLLTLIAALVMT